VRPRGDIRLTQVRDETPDDAAAIAALTTAAFRGAPHASGTEAAIVDVLRATNALTISLAAVDDSGIVGHIAFSPVTIVPPKSCR